MNTTSKNPPTSVVAGDYLSYYSRLNDLTPEGRRLHWPDYRRIYAPFLPKNKKARIVDIGCGAGQFMEWLEQDLGYENVQGIEMDAHMVAFAAECAIDGIEVCDLRAWRVQGTFDCIILKDVLEHIPTGEQIEALRLLAGKLAPDGCLIVRVPNANSTFATRHLFIDPTHYRSYSEHSLRSELERTGFSRIEIHGDDVWVPQSPKGVPRLGVKLLVRAFRRLEAAAEYGREGLSMPLSLNLVAVARR
ncbi:MAG: class I SAM-dependent methyltransferase [Acidobacteriia bacterium]|nr:class I SAM-dependent methyltransferase [Terriglobia bacterium]